MLRKGIISNDNIVYAVRASRHLSPARLAEAFNTIDEAVKKVRVEVSKEVLRWNGERDEKVTIEKL